ncbi:MAG: MFS transporter [Acidovorax sp.]|jgi:hypothetical protein|nr:MFS transporter [Acidovorax sp.]
MFEAPVALAWDRRQHGQKAAVEIVGDIHEYTKLYSSKESVDYPWINARQLFDFNEHFIEWGSPVRDRGGAFMTSLLVMLLVIMPILGFYWIYIYNNEFTVTSVLILLGGLLFGWLSTTVYWYIYLRATLLTALCARYRFNRTTRKVYVLRPRQFGGNVVLDWDRVQAHPYWRAPGNLKLEPGFQHNTGLREARANASGGFMMTRGLLLYWPPLDAEDPNRKGEELLWVGQWQSGVSDWEYIRRFMEEGMDAVPKPEASHYRRKGRSTMLQHYWEEEMDPEIRQAELLGEPDPRAKLSFIGRLLPLPFLFANSLGQWLCYWPTFPKEWNSDCGQKRRESGIGPEEPLRWEAKL